MLCFFYSFTASDGSEGSTAGRVVSPWSIIMHHCFTSKEARRARKQRYRLRKTTSHSSLLVARQGDVSHKLNHVFLLVDSFNFNFVDENVQIYTSLFTCLCSKYFIDVWIFECLSYHFDQLDTFRYWVRQRGRNGYFTYDLYLIRYAISLVCGSSCIVCTYLNEAICRLSRL